MGQVAFDTQEFVETLENAGLPKEQAKAISIAVRKSHEVADVATKRDLEDVRKDLTTQITEVRKDLSVEIALVRKDVEHIATGLLLKLGGVIVVTISAATAILKFF
ncbi:MAG: DUF1640 domain-containing protein [Candidatus Arsenophonus phytopathogenicus]